MENSVHSEKEILIFNAVTKLMSEGVKLHTVKVADIAKAAGIGKGTIYDYFKSKEEILEKALLYNMGIELNEALEKIKGKKYFKEKFYVALDLVAKASRDYSSASSILFSNLSHHEFKEILENNIECINNKHNRLKEVIDEIVCLGISEGLIKEQEDKEYKFMVFESVVMGFGNSICINPKYDKDEVEKYKDRAYKLLIKGLN